jgi:hypothetical protein
MSPLVELHGSCWCVYQDGEAVFSGDYRKVEDWLDHAEFSSKYPVPPKVPKLESRMSVVCGSSSSCEMCP